MTRDEIMSDESTDTSPTANAAATSSDPSGDPWSTTPSTSKGRPDRPTPTATNPSSNRGTLDVFYGDVQALQSIDIEIPERQVTAMIGPSGCGKSTFLRCINRMNDLIDAARVDGELYFEGKNVYDDDVDPVALRRRIGMVFQHPNPFPKSIYDNVAYGLRIQDQTEDLDQRVETALKRAALWDEVKDRLTRARWTSRAGNSSDSASPAPSPSTLTSS